VTAHWTDAAACRGMGPDAFTMPGGVGHDARAKIERALDTCRRCPVLEPCRADTLARGYAGGLIAGGLLPHEQGPRHHYSYHDVIIQREVPVRVDTRTDPTWDERCGTFAGASRHVRRGERQCGPCAVARARYDRLNARRRAQRDEGAA